MSKEIRFCQPIREYYLSITDLDAARSEQNILRKKLGMNTYSLFIRPDRMQKIIDTMRKTNKLDIQYEK